MYAIRSYYEIREDSVLIEHEGKPIPISNDAVIVSAGGILPTGFLSYNFV